MTEIHTVLLRNGVLLSVEESEFDDEVIITVNGKLSVKQLAGVDIATGPASGVPGATLILGVVADRTRDLCLECHEFHYEDQHYTHEYKPTPPPAWVQRVRDRQKEK